MSARVFAWLCTGFRAGAWLGVPVGEGFPCFLDVLELFQDLRGVGGAVLEGLPRVFQGVLAGVPAV